MSRNQRSLVGLVSAGLLLVVPACDDPPKSDTKTAKADKGKKDSENKDKPKEKAGKDAAGKDGDAKAEDKAGDKPEGDKAGDAPEGDKAGDAPEGDAAAEGGGGSDAPSVPPGDAGPAYFAIDDKGVFVLDGGEVKAVKKGPDKLVRQMSVGPDGKAYMLGFDGVMRIEAGAAKVIAKTSFKKTGTVDSFAITPEGEVWTAGYKGVAHHDGKKWTLEEKTALGADVKLLKGIALDKDGKIWVASSNSLHVKDGEAWKAVDVSKVAKRKPYFDTLTADPKTGAIYAPASSFVLKATAADAVEDLKVPSQGLSSFGMMTFAQNGIGALKTDPKHVARIVDGATATFEMNKDFAGTRVHQLSVDGQGRVWVATDIGITVMGPGAERAKWMSGSIPELAGKVKGILVVGAGPELPEVGEVQKGTVTGKIQLDGAPLADADIEMCPEPGTLIKKSPCEDSPTTFSGKTAADGAFEFKDAPLGAYGIAVKVGDKWKTTLSGQYGAKMKPGAAYDLGTLKFKAK